MSSKEHTKLNTEPVDVEAEVASALALMEELSIKSSDSGLSEETCWEIFGGPCPEALRKKIKYLDVDESVEEEEDFYSIEQSSQNKVNIEKENVKSNDAMNDDSNINSFHAKVDAEKRSFVEEKIETTTPEVKSISNEKKDPESEVLQDEINDMTILKNEESSKIVEQKADQTKEESNGENHYFKPISENSVNNNNLVKEEKSLKNNSAQLSKSSQEAKITNDTSKLTQENDNLEKQENYIHNKSNNDSKISRESKHMNDKNVTKEQVSLRSESKTKKQEKINSQELNGTVVNQENFSPKEEKSYKDIPINSIQELKNMNTDLEKLPSVSLAKEISPLKNLENNKTSMNVSKNSSGKYSTKSVDNAYITRIGSFSHESFNGKNKKVENTQSIPKRKSILEQEINESEELIKTEDLEVSKQNLRRSAHEIKGSKIHSVDVGISASPHKSISKKGGSGSGYKVIEEIKKNISTGSKDDRMLKNKKQQTSATKTIDTFTSASHDTLESINILGQISSLDDKLSTSLKTSLTSDIISEKMYQPVINDRKECDCPCCVERQIRKSYKKDSKCTGSKTKPIACRCGQSFEKCHVKIFEEKEVDVDADCREHFLQITSFSGDKTTFSNKKVQTSTDDIFHKGDYRFSGPYMPHELNPLCPYPEDLQPAYLNNIRNRSPPRQYKTNKKVHGTKNKWRETSSSSDITESKVEQRHSTEGFCDSHVSSTKQSLVGALTNSILKRSVKDTVKNFEKNRLVHKHIPNYQSNICRPRNIQYKENNRNIPKPLKNETCECCNKPKHIIQRQLHQQRQKSCACCSYKNNY